LGQSAVDWLVGLWVCLMVVLLGEQLVDELAVKTAGAMAGAMDL
jgi:hypothetical protein